VGKIEKPCEHRCRRSIVALRHSLGKLTVLPSTRVILEHQHAFLMICSPADKFNMRHDFIFFRFIRAYLGPVGVDFSNRRHIWPVPERRLRSFGGIATIFRPQKRLRRGGVLVQGDLLLKSRGCECECECVAGVSYEDAPAKIIPS